MLTIRNKISAMLICLAILGPQTTLALTEQQQSMLRQIDQLDNLDLLDSDAKANACIMSHDFTCAEKEIAKASRLARTQQQKTLIQLTLQNLAMERSLLEAQQQARRDREEAEEAAEIAEERAIRAQERAQEEAENNQRLKLAAMSAGFILGGGGELSAERQAAAFQAIAQDSYGSGASNFTSAMNNIKAQQQAQSQQQAEMLAEQRALQERQALARTAAASEQSASRQVTKAPNSSVEAVSKQAPQIVEYVTQTVVIPDWSTPCPPGYKPAQENGRNITAGSGGGVCIKDATASGKNSSLADDTGEQQISSNQLDKLPNPPSAQQAEEQKTILKAESEKQDESSAQAQDAKRCVQLSSDVSAGRSYNKITNGCNQSIGLSYCHLPSNYPGTRETTCDEGGRYFQQFVTLKPGESRGNPYSSPGDAQIRWGACFGNETNIRQTGNGNFRCK